MARKILLCSLHTLFSPTFYASASSFSVRYLHRHMSLFVSSTLQDKESKVRQNGSNTDLNLFFSHAFLLFRSKLGLRNHKKYFLLFTYTEIFWTKSSFLKEYISDYSTFICTEYGILYTFLFRASISIFRTLFRQFFSTLLTIPSSRHWVTLAPKR